MKESIKKVLAKKSPQKAADIAKALGATRKEVNSFLHKNTDSFAKDDDFQWSEITGNELTVNLQPKNWIDCKSLEDSLVSAGSPLDSACNYITFIIPEKSAILLEASARLLALCNQLVHAGKKVKLDFSVCKQTLTYLDRVGVLTQLHDDISVVPAKPKEARALKFAGKSDALVEVGSIDPAKANKEIIIKLTKTFVNLAGEGYETVAFTIFSELVGNVSEHSQTPIPGFAALQVYSANRKHIQTIVSDSGLGISKTLRPSLKSHYPSLHRQYHTESLSSDVALVIEAISQGEISRFGAGRGLGFKSTTKQAMKFDAKLSIRQETFSIMLQFENGEISDVKKFTDLVKINGTHICFDFYVD
ncbi:MAG: ATP-binding protein [Pseudomonadota bacterium]